MCWLTYYFYLQELVLLLPAEQIGYKSKQVLKSFLSSHWTGVPLISDNAGRVKVDFVPCLRLQWSPLGTSPGNLSTFPDVINVPNTGPVEAIGSWSGHVFHDACALGNRAAPPTFAQFLQQRRCAVFRVLGTVRVFARSTQLPTCCTRPALEQKIGPDQPDRAIFFFGRGLRT